MSTIKDFLTGSNDSKESKIKEEKTEKIEQKIETKIEGNKTEINKEEQTKKETKKLRGNWQIRRKIQTIISKLNPVFWKNWILSHYYEYKRVLSLAKRPEMIELKELGLVVVVSAIIVGILGLIFELIFYGISLL